MNFLPSFSPPALLTGVPDGYDSLLLAELSQSYEQLVYIAHTENKALNVREQLGFFKPKTDILFFPSWDCLPYDRTSPHPDILGERTDTLISLASGKKSYLLITTLQAVLQKLPPPETFQGRSLFLSKGREVEYEGLLAFLSRNGYVRRDIVQEWGEYAVRGGLLDLFPPGHRAPVRLDFFGKTLENIRSFDPLSQTTTGLLETVLLNPMGEVQLTPETCARFQKGYRSHFGAPDSKDPLYQAIADGRPFGGYEHWLPLFYDHLVPLSTYVPGALYCLDGRVEKAEKAYQDQIQEHYQARLDFRSLGFQEMPYHPLPPDQLYFMGSSLDKLIPSSHKVSFESFGHPKGIEAGGKILPPLSQKGRPQDTVFENLKKFLIAHQTQKTNILLVGVTQGSAERLGHILEEHSFPPFQKIESFQELSTSSSAALTAFELDHGFEAPGLVVITEEDILGERLGRPLKPKKRQDLFIQEISTLQLGDFVVHQDHGLGRYQGLKTVTINGGPHDCLEIHYEGNDKLYVPVENIDVLSRYGAKEAQASLDKLGGVAWQAKKARVKKRLKEIADALLKIAAARHIHQADIFSKPEGLYDEFAARFPYPETDDQLTAIEDVFQDLSAGKPMDRLICGDVGFGKTEVAMRAAFLVASSGKQVALIVPTTLLARQHYQSFEARFQGTALKVAQLSRLLTAREASLVKEQVKNGEIQILIGTHALFSQSLEFADLGLLIVDEEQHFGVSQKEKLKNLKPNVHVLTLTATPIPRTLQMALSGVREMSLITTPPLDRMAVRTFVLPFDEMVIREAILREHFRGGQIFYVCPRISDLEKVNQHLQRIVPEVKVAVAHGQMSPRVLESVMTSFYEGTFDVLLSTQIIESGIDIPRANTLIIHKADLFGLAQLYQLRGRIGRGKVRGYAYLTYGQDHLLTTESQKRLEVIQSLDTLGAGFTLASHDMDIRGGGNLIGAEQSGHIREVGIELYQHMLEEAILTLKAEKQGEPPPPRDYVPQISVNLPILIPEAYVSDLSVRLALYKRLSTLVTRQEIDQFAAELVDRFGSFPREVQNLLEVIYLKLLARKEGIEKVDVGPKGVVLSFYQNTFRNPDRLIAHILDQKGTAKIRPDQKVVYLRSFATAESSLSETAKILEEISAL